MSDDKVLISRRALKALLSEFHCCPSSSCRVPRGSGHFDDCPFGEALKTPAPSATPADTAAEPVQSAPPSVDLAAEVVMLLQRVVDLEAETETLDAQVTNRLAEMETRITKLTAAHKNSVLDAVSVAEALKEFSEHVGGRAESAFSSNFTSRESEPQP